MTFLQLLRQSKPFARLALLWFALSLTVAVAAPLVHVQNTTLVCTAAGQVKLVSDGDAASDQGAVGALGAHHSLNCVLCLALDAPPVQASALPLLLPQTGALPVAASTAWVPQRHPSQVSARGPPALA